MLVFASMKIACNLVSGLILLYSGQAIVWAYVELYIGEAGSIFKMGNCTAILKN